MNEDILKSIYTMVNQEIQNAGFDKTRTGLIHRANIDGTYTVEIDNRLYANVPILTGYYCEVGDVVKVNYPCGNSSQMYISSGRPEQPEIYQVGDIYITVSTENPADRFGGQWEQIENRFLLEAGSNYDVNDTGGYADQELLAHNHTASSTSRTTVASHNHTASSGTQSANHSHTPADSTFPNFNVQNTDRMTRRRVNQGTQGAQLGYQWYQETNASSPYYVGSTTRTSTNSASHTHTVTVNSATPTASTTTTTTVSSAGDITSGTGRNMPPYFVVYIWKRVA